MIKFATSRKFSNQQWAPTHASNLKHNIKRQGDGVSQSFDSIEQLVQASVLWLASTRVA